MRGQRGDHRAAEVLAQVGDRSGVGEQVDRGVHVVGAAAALGHDLAQGLLVGRLEVRSTGPWK